jgi:hypothetical protein
MDIDVNDIERTGITDSLAPSFPGSPETELLSKKLDQAWALLTRLSAAVHNSEEDQDSGILLSEIAEMTPEIDAFVWGEFNTSERVEAVVVMEKKGKYFPKGVHHRSGRIIKHGTVENSWLVELDEPLGEEKVVTLPTISIRSLDETN